MTTENSEYKTVAEMIRITNDNTFNFYQQVADHIEKLEATIADLNDEIARLKGDQNEQVE